MERLGYTRLYATVTGTLLVLIGLFGFLVNAEFKTPFLTDDLLGVMAVNGWANSLRIAIGLLALVMAQRFSRAYAIIAGIGLTALGLWGILATNGQLLADKLPAGKAANLLNLIFGLLGLAALVAVHAPGLGERMSKRIDRRKRHREANKRRRRLRKTAKASQAKSPKAQSPERSRKPSVSDRTRDDG